LQLLGAIVALVILASGCEKPTDSDFVRDPNTPSYFNEIFPDQSELFNWRYSNGSVFLDILIWDGADSTPAGFDAEGARALFHNSLSAWTDAIEAVGVRVRCDLHWDPWWYGEERQLPRLEIFYREQVLGNDGEEVRGITHVRLSNSMSSFGRVVIEVDADLEGDAFEHTLTHELGHALGLLTRGEGMAHSSNENDIMYPGGAAFVGLSSGDSLTIQRLYSKQWKYQPLEVATIRNGSAVHNSIYVKVDGNQIQLRSGERIQLAALPRPDWSDLELWVPHENYWLNLGYLMPGIHYSVIPDASSLDGWIMKVDSEMF
jgi:hypothetical protein